jgi:hypothetical protein
MPTPLKPCDGDFSEELQEVLRKNRDRAQWADHPCQTCGFEVGAVQVKGRWVPAPHWPSVKYPVRKAAGEKASKPTRRPLEPAEASAL